MSLEQKLLRSQLNPHFIFNALNTASALAHKKSDKTVPYIASLGRLLRGILESSREEFISLEDEVSTLTNYLELQSDFSHTFTFTVNVDQSIEDMTEILLPPMFIQPFAENAIVHGFRGESDDFLKISFATEPQTLCCTIQDNGIGYSKTIDANRRLNHESLSGKILKERLELYAKKFKTKALFTIDDLPPEIGGGTRVNIILPLVKDV